MSQRGRHSKGEKLNLKYLVKYAKKYWFLLATSIVFLAAQAYGNLMLPNMMSKIVNVGIQEFSQKILLETNMSQVEVLKAQQTQYIVEMGIIMLILTIGITLIALIIQFSNSKMGASIARDLRKDLFTKIEGFSSEEFDRFSTASLITRTTNDVQQIQMVFSMGIRILIFAPIMGVGAIFMAVSKSPSMAWINALTVLLVIALMVVTFAAAMPKFKIIQTLVDRLNLIARESLTGMMVVRAFSKQSYEEKRFDDANLNYSKNNLFVNRVMSLMSPTMGLIQNVIPVLIILIGAGKIATSQLKVGDMMAFIQYSGTIMQSFMMISMIFIMFPRANVSIKRIAEVLDTEFVIKQCSSPKIINDDTCTIEFNNVCFQYPNSEEKVLTDINFTVKSGQTTAIIGSTGCGKTSLVNLIPRLYEVSSGSVKINGIDVRELQFDNLRNLIGYVPQKSTLFSGTIKSNIAVGNQHITEQQMAKVAQIAQAEDFIQAKEEKYDFPISQGGSNVSGGQRQRLSIARAIAKQAKIYIFDDSFSALDFKTDFNLRKALKKNVSSAAVIIVGQRVASVMNADQIIVMDNGAIVGKGTHDELIKSCTEYQEIAYSQLSKEEM